MTDHALEVNGLTVEYRLRTRGGRHGRVTRAVDDVSFVVASGETLALVGESGSGKSSIAKAVMRLVDISAGNVSVAGIDITALHGGDLRDARSAFQMIFQDPFESLDPRRTVMQTVMESLIVAQAPGTNSDHEIAVLAALTAVGLTPAETVATRYTHELSGGQRQRVAIAAAMVVRPELLVADEPVSMLDVSLRAGILRLLRQMTQDGAGCLFITHDLSLAWMFADRIAVLYLGRIVEEGLAHDVISSPQHPYTRALVSVIPVPGRRTDQTRTVLAGEIPDAAHVPAGCAFHPRCPLYRQRGEPVECRTMHPRLTVSGPHQVACHLVKE